MRPQAALVEVRDLGEGVEAAAMGIAGDWVERLELAEDGEAGVGAQDALELGQIGDFVFAQMSAEGSGVEGGRPHNVIVRSFKVCQQEL